MKKIIILLILSVFSLNSFSQNALNKGVVFVFDDISNFKNQFKNEDLPKEFTFKVRNLKEENRVDFTNNISKYRGVTNIEISDVDADGERTANLSLYKYADYWKYYEYFFSKNGVYKIIINNIEYNPAQIGNYK